MIGGWLEMNEAKKDSSGAKKLLKKALRTLPALWNQINQDALDAP
jgi:hypothetical protein